MPSTFDDDFEQLATPHLVAAFGEEITYTVDGEPTTLTATVLDERLVEEATQTGRDVHAILDVEIGRDPSADRGGIENPRVDATVTIRGVVYAVREIAEQSAYSTTLRVIRKTSKERTRAKYRG